MEPQNKSAAAKLGNSLKLVSLSTSYLGPLLQDVPSQNYQGLWVLLALVSHVAVLTMQARKEQILTLQH